MIDLMCIDCGAEFEEDELIDYKCPECGSSRYDYYDEVMEDGDTTMIDIEYLINILNKATVLEVKRDKNSFITVSIHIPTNDLDEIYSVFSGGKGFVLHWKGMDLLTEDITFSKGDFNLLHKEVLKELMKHKEK